MRQVRYRLWVDWDFDDDYTEETANMVTASGSLRVVGPDEYLTGGRGQVGSCSITMHNPDGRYSHHNWDGALFANLYDGGSYYAPMYLEVSVDGGSNYSRIFTGVIKTIPNHTAAVNWCVSSAATAVSCSCSPNPAAGCTRATMRRS